MMRGRCSERAAKLLAAALLLATTAGCATTTDVTAFLDDFARQVFAAWVL